MRTLAPSSSTLNRTGYTLAEVLIASVLVASLMAVCWNLMGLYSGFLSAGREKVVERQIARSLFEIIQEDVRVVSAPTKSSLPPPPLPDTAPMLATVGEPVETSRVGFEPFGASMFDESSFTADTTVRLLGTSTSLSITYLVDHPGSRDVGAVERPEDLLDDIDDSSQLAASANTIVYHFEPPTPGLAIERPLPFGLHRVEASAFAYQEALEAQRLANAEDSSLRSSGVLNRFTYDALFQPVDEVTSGLDEIAGPVFEPTHDHVPEAVRVHFEYYDGTNWISNWNTQGRRSLPSAIRVTLWLISNEELATAREVLAFEADASGSMEVDLPNIRPRRYRRVISLSPHTQLDTDSMFAEGTP